MRDWTYSLMRDASMSARKYNGYSIPPPKEPNTTILKLYLLPGQYTALVSPDESFEEIMDATLEGKALLKFLTSIGKEPGHDLRCGDEFASSRIVSSSSMVMTDNSMLSSQKMPD